MKVKLSKSMTSMAFVAFCGTCTACVSYIESLPPSAFCFVLSFFFACGLACLLPTSPSWSRQLRHIWHLRHTRNTGTAAHASILACQLRPFALACAHLANHGAHLVKLLKKLVELLYAGPTSTSNTLTPTAIDDVGIATRLQGHREDHCLYVFELIAFQSFFHFGRRRQFVEARNHLHDLAQWPHTFQLTHGVEKIFQI